MSDMGKALVDGLAGRISGLPNDFYSTFQYTTRGKNLTHPLTLWYISEIVASMPTVVRVGVDVRLNNGRGTKFQPDIVGFDGAFEPVVIVDYESPNSSDARVPAKKWTSYAAWREEYRTCAPYLLITTLPKFRAPSWQLRWVGPHECNNLFRGRLEDIRNNPFEFWYAHDRARGEQCNLENITMINISGHTVAVVPTEG